MESMIEIRQLEKTYSTAAGEIFALRGVNLTVQPGEFVAIVGSSGSGKSTLMNILGCLDSPTAGSYRLSGREVSCLPDRELTRIRQEQIGFVFQSFHLIPTLSAVENVALPLMYRGVPAAERHHAAAEVLTKMGLGERLHHRPAQLSGGQQQRVAIARAVVGDPPLLLADEPTGNLDRDNGAQVMALLQSLHRKGKTIVLITHDAAVAAGARRMVTLTDGVLTEKPLPC